MLFQASKCYLQIRLFALFLFFIYLEEDLRCKRYWATQ